MGERTETNDLELAHAPGGGKRYVAWFMLPELQALLERWFVQHGKGGDSSLYQCRFGR